MEKKVTPGTHFNITPLRPQLEFEHAIRSWRKKTWSDVNTWLCFHLKVRSWEVRRNLPLSLGASCPYVAYLVCGFLFSSKEVCFQKAETKRCRDPRTLLTLYSRCVQFEHQMLLSPRQTPQFLSSQKSCFSSLPIARLLWCLKWSSFRRKGE